jgi:hypothetical protein
MNFAGSARTREFPSVGRKGDRGHLRDAGIEPDQYIVGKIHGRAARSVQDYHD